MLKQTPAELLDQAIDAKVAQALAKGSGKQQPQKHVKSTSLFLDTYTAAAKGETLIDIEGHVQESGKGNSAPKPKNGQSPLTKRGKGKAGPAKGKGQGQKGEGKKGNSTAHARQAQTGPPQMPTSGVPKGKSGGKGKTKSRTSTPAGPTGKGRGRGGGGKTGRGTAKGGR